MNKNVLVFDSNRQPLGETYMRRAKSLVKKGRARWVDGTTITLVSPGPSYETEVVGQMSGTTDAISIPHTERFEIDLDTLGPTHLIRIPGDGDGGYAGQMNRLLEELRNILPLVAGAEVTTAISTIVGIDGADPDIKADLVKQIAMKSLDVKADIFARIENIFHCVTGN